jgi:outer membrane protein assembly factor BamB
VEKIIINIKKIFIFLLIFLILISCNKSNQENIIENKSIPSNETKINFNDFNIKWKFDTYEFINSSLINDDTIYIAGNNLYAFDIDTGNLKWESWIGNLINFNFSPGLVFFDNSIYLTTDNNACCINKQTGSINWEYRFENGYQIMSSPKVYKNKVFIGFESSKEESNGIIILDAKSGNKINIVKLTKDPIRESTVSFELYDDLLCILGDTWIRTVNINNYNEVKIINFDDRLSNYEISDNKIFAASKYKYMLSATDIHTGKKLWELNSKQWGFGSFLIKNKVIYFASHNSSSSMLYAADFDTGKILWNLDLKNLYLPYSPTIENDNIYFIAESLPCDYNVVHDYNVICAVESSTGKLLWNKKLGLRATSDIKIKNNVLYFGCEDAKFYALNLKK